MFSRAAIAVSICALLAANTPVKGQSCRYCEQLDRLTRDITNSTPSTLSRRREAAWLFLRDGLPADRDLTEAEFERMLELVLLLSPRGREDYSVAWEVLAARYDTAAPA